ncbi:MAG: rhodanese-like domain-containing protein [Flavobacteriaceae bacterium]|nr:rhodanese-like domain-containing protein [Flavobacteriaceae bacterium]
MEIQEILEQGNYHLIDVREPEELLTFGEIEGATNIPLGQIEDHEEEIRNLNGNIIFFCRSGGRSQKAVDFFTDKGLANIYNGGGYDDVAELL